MSWEQAFAAASIFIILRVYAAHREKVHADLRALRRLFCRTR
jgi:hypothetical protein